LFSAREIKSVILIFVSCGFDIAVILPVQ
jgi:hypothetical protein